MKTILLAVLALPLAAQTIDIVDASGFFRTATLGPGLKLLEKDGRLLIDVPPQAAPNPVPVPDPKPTPSPLPTPAVPTLFLFTSTGPAPVEIGSGLVLANVDGKFRLSLDSAVFTSSAGFRPAAPYIPKERAVELAIAGKMPARGWCEGEKCLVNLCGTPFTRVLVVGGRDKTAPEVRDKVLALPRPALREDGGISSVCN
jgi:hypothetical protein